MALPSPSPFSLPLLSLTYIPRQQSRINVSRAAAGLGVAPSATPHLLGEALPKIHTVGLSIPPPKIHTAGHPPFPIPQPHPPSGAQNQTMGNWPLRGTVLGGVLFAPPVLGPWAIDHKSKEMGVEVQLWEPHFLGPSGSLALFCSFGLLNISGPPGPPSHLPIPNLSPTNPPILGQT